MRIETFNNFDPKLQTLWEGFQETIESSPFQSYSWLENWQKSIGDPLIRIKPYIVVIYEKEEVIAILPLGKRKVFGIKILEWLGGVNSDYMCPLISKKRDSFNRDFEDIWNKIIEEAKPIDLVYLTKQFNFENNNPFISKLKNRFLMNSYQSVLTNNWESFSKENLSRKVLADSRRQRKRLSEIGYLSFNIAESKEEIEEITRLMIKQKSRRYVDSGNWDMLNIDEYKKFYLNIQSSLGSLGNIHVSYLSLDEKIIATHWGIVSSERFYYLMPTHEGGSWEKFSTGKLLLEFLIRWALENGLKIFDLTGGDELYKKKWSTTVSPIYEHISPTSFFGKIYIFVYELQGYIKRMPLIGKAAKRIYNFIRQ